MNREANTGLKHCDKYKPITLSFIQSERQEEDRALLDEHIYWSNFVAD